MLPLENLLPVYKFVNEEDLFDPKEERFIQLAELDEMRREAQNKNLKAQAQMELLYDRKSNNRKFHEGEWVLMWNVRQQDKGKHGKFEAL